MSLSSKTRTRFPVRVYLLSLVVIAVLPPLIFATIVLMRFSDSQLAQAENRLIVSARGVARSIDAEFTTAAATLRVLRSSSLLGEGSLEAFSQRLRNATEDTGRRFLLIEAGGRQVVSTVQPPRTAHLKVDEALLAEAFAEKGLYVSDVLIDPGSQEPFTFVALPVERAGQLRWILATALYSTDFASVVNSPGVPDDWIVSLVDRRGTHIRRSHFNADFAGRPLVPDLVRHMEAHGTGTVRTISLEGIALISTIAYAPLTGWGAAVGLPVEKLEAPLGESLRQLLITGMVMAAVAVSLAFLVARVLDQGFATLRQSARKLDRGEIVDRHPSPVREVEDVVEAMAHVSLNLRERSKALRELNESLEAQVSERTEALVSEMKRREASETQLRQLQRMEAVGKLTGGIAHDFNNMLAVVMSSLSLLQRHLARGDTDVKKYVEGAIQGAESAANLTRRLLAFSRQQALRPEVVDCNRLIEGMTDIFERTIQEHIEIETRLGDALWPTYVDASGLENAILNLVVNARDAMPDGGKMTIATRNVRLDDSLAARDGDIATGDYVLIEVSDSGTGIEKEVLENVFEPFFTTKELGQGTGLGLSQVHGFIKQSGGHIQLESEPGRGTTVSLYLSRLAKQAAATPRQPAKPTSLPLSRNRETILVVEDELQVRAGTVQMLEELGYTVLEADSGPAALEMLEDHSEVDLLLTDVVMPGMNGQQLAEQALMRWPGLRVLLVSGYTRDAIASQELLGAEAHLLAKPFTLEVLARKVAELLPAASDA